MDLFTISSLIKAKRKKCKITQTMLEEISGVSRKTISDIENNKTLPSHYTLNLLMSSLKLRGEDEELERFIPHYAKYKSIKLNAENIIIRESYYDLTEILREIENEVTAMDTRYVNLKMKYDELRYYIEYFLLKEEDPENAVQTLEKILKINNEKFRYDISAYENLDDIQLRALILMASHKYEYKEYKEFSVRILKCINLNVKNKIFINIVLLKKALYSDCSNKISADRIIFFIKNLHEEIIRSSSYEYLPNLIELRAFFYKMAEDEIKYKIYEDYKFFTNVIYNPEF